MNSANQVKEGDVWQKLTKENMFLRDNECVVSASSRKKMISMEFYYLHSIYYKVINSVIITVKLFLYILLLMQKLLSVTTVVKTT